MLEYEWGNASSILLPGEEPSSDSDQTRQSFDAYNQTLTGNLLQPAAGFSSNAFQQQQQLNHTPLQTFDARAHTFSSYPRQPVSPSLAGVGFSTDHSFQAVDPSIDEFSGVRGDFPARIGLNLGVRTYFSSTEDDLISRLYRRSRQVEPGPANSPRCQVEGCNADLTHAKHYHRRHKVCEFHSKASTVVAAGLNQRFCQQCSRFHLLSEFDHGKRSCRKRLADHNRRRRKSQPQQLVQSQSENATTSLAPVETPSKSSPESSTPSSSSVSIAISPPQLSFDCFRSATMTTHKASGWSSSCSSHFSPSRNFRPYERQMWVDEDEDGQ